MRVYLVSHTAGPMVALFYAASIALGRDKVAELNFNEEEAEKVINEALERGYENILNQVDINVLITDISMKAVSLLMEMGLSVEYVYSLTSNHENLAFIRPFTVEDQELDKVCNNILNVAASLFSELVRSKSVDTGNAEYILPMGVCVNMMLKMTLGDLKIGLMSEKESHEIEVLFDVLLKSLPEGIKESWLIEKGENVSGVDPLR